MEMYENTSFGPFFFLCAIVVDLNEYFAVYLKSHLSPWELERSLTARGPIEFSYILLGSDS